MTAATLLALLALALLAAAPARAAVVDIDSEPQFRKIINTTGARPVVVFFTDRACQRCTTKAATFDLFGQQYGGAADFVKVNVRGLWSSVPEASKVWTFPTFQIYQDGKMVSQQTTADMPALEVLIKAATA